MINNINGFPSVSNTYNKTIEKKETNKQPDAKASTDKVATNKENEVAATYEKSEEATAPVKKENNKDIIAKLKADTEMRTAQLKSLVEKMFSKQGITFNNSDEMYSILRSGNFTVDPDVAAKAKEDISEDGYWGVKQTSDRMVDFAKALSGNDPEKADKMIAAIKKGYEQAEKTWGGKLPDICQQTLDTTIKKLEEWRDGITNSSDKEVQEV